MTFVTDLRSTLQASAEPGCRYNIQLMNALVLYVGTQAIAAIQAKGLQPNKQTITHSSHMDIFQSLAVDLDTEGESRSSRVWPSIWTQRVSRDLPESGRRSGHRG